MAPRKITTLPLLAAFALVLGSSAAHAHTDADLVAVPAGSEATLTLEPTHGCGESATVEVAIQAPVAGAVPGEVEGWTATATADGTDRTVLEWKGGPLPADESGAFPVTFTAPDAEGELLVFPSVQVCENGEELAWIEGDPESDYPAPRILVLPAGSEPATSIDDVPADAPGRDQLTAIIDVDNPEADTTTEPEATTTTDGAAEEGEATDVSTTAEETDTPVVGDTETENEAQSQDDERSVAVLVAIALVVVIGAVAAYMFTRKRRPQE